VRRPQRWQTERAGVSTIAVAGGTGTVGTHVVRELAGRGHEVRVLTRRSAEFPVDLTTGAGLQAALDGCEIVIDVSNTKSARRAEQLLVEGSRRLLAAAAAAGVRHHVCVSIVGCDRTPTGYYRVKVCQEEAVERGGVSWSIVRATQFHDLIAWALGKLRWAPVLPVPRARLQPVASSEVAVALADVALGEPLGGRLEVAGPEVRSLRELDREWRSITGARGPHLPLPVPSPLGRALRAGTLTNPDPDVRGQMTFAEWLGRRSAHDSPGET
jgi:uncharacterized protein YbjT (DUF2867 family)